jgi:glycerate-2-kinase
MIEFKFKRINQKVTPHYRPPALIVGDSTRTVALNSNMGATVRFGQTIILQPTHHTTSARVDGSAHGTDGIVSRAGATIRHCLTQNSSAFHDLKIIKFSYDTMVGVATKR